MLWLCIHLPQLPLEVYTRALADEGPRVVFEGTGRGRYVLACNGAARALGIRPGMGVGAAQALGNLRIFERDPARERAALAGLAAWSVQFTPLASIAPRHALLLEVAGSLKLFGGLEALGARIREGLTALAFEHRLAAAPTPLAAIWLARSGRAGALRDPRTLHARLGELPLAVLDLEPDHLSALRGMGLDRIGDLLRLPRAGLAQRIDPGLIAQLDRAFGARPDPRPFFELPARFESAIELPDPIGSTEGLLFVAHRQLLELTGFLQARCSGAQRLEWTLHHRRAAPTRITLGLLAPHRDPDHLARLLRERLARLALPAPVLGVTLVVEDVIALEDESRDLFPNAPAHRAGQRASLVERLRARLGPQAVTGLCLVPDHRPERAWRACDPGTQGPSPEHFGRPLWLLAHPLPLACEAGRPVLEGRLRTCSARERIEAGWWDGADVARDYFMAENPRGGRFWIFRDLERDGWFLHGVFE
jgi:protein ImuB